MKNQNFKNYTQSATTAGHTTNSTTIELSKQNTTGTNAHSQLYGKHLLRLSQIQAEQLDPKKRRPIMPKSLEQAIQRARQTINRSKSKSDLRSARDDKVSPQTKLNASNGTAGSTSQSQFIKTRDTQALSRAVLQKTYENLHPNYQEMKAVNDLVYNEPTHLVSVFKDFLILDDINEFLKRPYTHVEQRTRLPKLFQFYESEMKQHQIYPGSIEPRGYPFPNYAALLPEPGNYVFKNVERRQRLRDQREYNIMKRDKKEEEAREKQDSPLQTSPEDEKKKDLGPTRLFDTRFVESVRLRHNDISNDDRSFKLTSSMALGDDKVPAENEQLEDSKNIKLVNISQYSLQASNIRKKQIAAGIMSPARARDTNRFPQNRRNHGANMEQLIQEFIMKDSLLQAPADAKRNSPREVRVSHVPWQDGLGINESLGGSSIRPLDRDATNNYELRLDTEDGEALGRQYESIFAARSRAAGESEMSFQTQRSIRISALMGDPMQIVNPIEVPPSTQPKILDKKSPDYNIKPTKHQALLTQRVRQAQNIIESMNKLKPVRPELTRTVSATNTAKNRASVERVVAPTASTTVLRTNNIANKKRKPAAGAAQSGGTVSTLTQPAASGITGLKQYSLKQLQGASSLPRTGQQSQAPPTPLGYTRDIASNKKHQFQSSKISKSNMPKTNNIALPNVEPWAMQISGHRTPVASANGNKQTELGAQSPVPISQHKHSDISYGKTNSMTPGPIKFTKTISIAELSSFPNKSPKVANRKATVQNSKSKQTQISVPRDTNFKTLQNDGGENNKFGQIKIAKIVQVEPEKPTRKSHLADRRRNDLRPVGERQHRQLSQEPATPAIADEMVNQVEFANPLHSSRPHDQGGEGIASSIPAETRGGIEGRNSKSLRLSNGARSSYSSTAGNLNIVESERRANGAMGTIVNAGVGTRSSVRALDGAKSRVDSMPPKGRTSSVASRSDDTVKLEDLQEAQYNLEQNTNTVVATKPVKQTSHGNGPRHHAVISLVPMPSENKGQTNGSNVSIQYSNVSRGNSKNFDALNAASNLLQQNGVNAIGQTRMTTRNSRQSMHSLHAAQDSGVLGASDLRHGTHLHTNMLASDQSEPNAIYYTKVNNMGMGQFVGLEGDVQSAGLPKAMTTQNIGLVPPEHGALGGTGGKEALLQVIREANSGNGALAFSQARGEALRRHTPHRSQNALKQSLHKKGGKSQGPASLNAKQSAQGKMRSVISPKSFLRSSQQLAPRMGVNGSTNNKQMMLADDKSQGSQKQLKYKSIQSGSSIPRAVQHNNYDEEDLEPDQYASSARARTRTQSHNANQKVVVNGRSGPAGGTAQKRKSTESQKIADLHAGKTGQRQFLRKSTGAQKGAMASFKNTRGSTSGLPTPISQPMMMHQKSDAAFTGAAGIEGLYSGAKSVMQSSNLYARRSSYTNAVQTAGKTTVPPKNGKTLRTPSNPGSVHDVIVHKQLSEDRASQQRRSKETRSRQHLASLQHLSGAAKASKEQTAGYDQSSPLASSLNNNQRSQISSNGIVSAANKPYYHQSQGRNNKPKAQGPGSTGAGKKPARRQLPNSNPGLTGGFGSSSTGSIGAHAAAALSQHDKKNIPIINLANNFQTRTKMKVSATGSQAQSHSHLHTVAPRQSQHVSPRHQMKAANQQKYQMQTLPTNMNEPGSLYLMNTLNGLGASGVIPLYGGTTQQSLPTFPQNTITMGDLSSQNNPTQTLQSENTVGNLRAQQQTWSGNGMRRHMSPQTSNDPRSAMPNSHGGIGAAEPFRQESQSIIGHEVELASFDEHATYVGASQGHAHKNVAQLQSKLRQQNNRL